MQPGVLQMLLPPSAEGDPESRLKLPLISKMLQSRDYQMQMEGNVNG